MRLNRQHNKNVLRRIYIYAD